MLDLVEKFVQQENGDGTLCIPVDTGIPLAGPLPSLNSVLEGVLPWLDNMPLNQYLDSLHAAYQSFFAG